VRRAHPIETATGVALVEMQQFRAKPPWAWTPHPVFTGTTGGVSFCFNSPISRPIAERKTQKSKLKNRRRRILEPTGETKT
jgi:hypothetical protein